MEGICGGKACVGPACSGCGVLKAKMRKCSNCHFAYYCTEKCQRNDWSQHKLVCRGLAHVFLSRKELGKIGGGFACILSGYDYVLFGHLLTEATSITGLQLQLDRCKGTDKFHSNPHVLSLHW